MKLIKTGMAIGLSIALLVSPVTMNTSSAAETGLNERVYSQLKGYNQKENNYQTSELTKNEDQQFSENQLVIKYSSPLSSTEHKKAGGKLVKRVAALGYDVIEIQGKRKLDEVAKGYASLGKVTSITRSAYGKTLATDPKANSMYHLKNLNIPGAHNLAGKNKVKVAVIDTGVDVQHPELTNKVVANINMMDPMKKGSPDSHGTHVSGIIAGEQYNGLGGYGIAPNAEIVSIDVSNRSFFITDYVVAEGILEAIRQKAKVINMSLGFYYPSPIMKDAVKKAIDSGITVVAAAGNDGASVLNYPASFEGVISVGATDDKNKLAFFSTFGPSVDVVAPGHNVYAPVYDIDKGSSFVNMSGTSMASPVVAGTVSLLLSKYPNLTPYQVNYMLTKTARDLGDKGYDLKYGYGLIDPVKLLSFDPKKIPADPKVKDGEILNKAKKLGTFESKSVIGNIQKLGQTDYYSVAVTKGENIQLSLTGLEKYDPKLELRFYENSKLTKTKEINDVGAGVIEGTLFQAPADGTLVVAVKDSFGKYHETGQYTYELELGKGETLQDEDQSIDNPFVVSTLPYQSSAYYFNDELSAAIEEEIIVTEDIDNEEESTEPSEDEEESSEDEEFRGVPGDSDFFRFKVTGSQDEEMQAVRVKLSNVPGIDSSIIIHAVEKMDGQEFFYEIERLSLKGYGGGEELIFNAVAGQDYILEVTNKPYIDEYMLMYGDFEIDYERSYSSFHPYRVSIETKSFPEDEDGLPTGYWYDSPEEALIEGDYEGYKTNKNVLQEMIYKSSATEENEYVQSIKDAAIPISENTRQEGYLQSYGDEDWYSFTPEHSSTYEFNIGKAYPVGITILKYNKEYKDFSPVYSNSEWISFDEMSVSTTFHVGLQEDETYYVMVTDPMYRPGFEQYQFSFKTKVKNTGDSFENNDSYEDATNITTAPLYANFAGVSDVDMYYFKPGKAGIYNVKVTPGVLPKAYRNTPAKLQSEIDPVLVIIEDTNGNRKLDEEEAGSQVYVDNTLYNEEERTGFKTKKNAGYFIITFDYFGVNSSLIPYIIKIDETNRKDEDAGSTVKNNIPSKPLSLDKNLTAKGYLNITTNQGDSDYYRLNVSKNKKVKLTLEIPNDIDGKVSIFTSKGALVTTLDSYGKGDNEIHEITLNKGTYYIKVEDVFGNASSDPYTLKIQ